jgi:hypothetical protein
MTQRVFLVVKSHEDGSHWLYQVTCRQDGEPQRGVMSDADAAKNYMVNNTMI